MDTVPERRSPDRAPGRASHAPHPALFALGSAPYGSFNGLIAVALPYVLEQHGIPLERIASIGALVQAPAIWYFLWAPVVDVGLPRRTWIILLSLASAVCAALAIGMDTGPAIRTMTVLLICASVFSQPVSSAVGGLIASVMRNEVRGRTAGWSQAGILGAGVLTGVIVIWLTGVASTTLTALVAAVMIATPAFAMLAVDERRPGKMTLRAHLASMFHDVVATLKRREVWLGLVFFLSPIGAGALMNLFSAMSSDFHASSDIVIWVVAIAGLLTPAGALVGGIICDRFDRWHVYPVAGLTAALAAGWVILAPLTPFTYLAGAAAYALATGFAYAAGMALALELLGEGSTASGTRFTLFMAAMNVPVVYMMRLDGLGHEHFGVRGMLATDALANGIFGLVLLGVTGGLRSLVNRSMGAKRVAAAVRREA